MPEIDRPPREAHLTVPADEAGSRLDVYVARHLGDLSRTQVRRLIDAGQITVSGARAKPSLPVSQGDEIVAVIPPATDSRPVSEDLPLVVLYEDADIVVIDKPAGMVVHPAAGHASGTLVNALLHHVRGLSGIGGQQRPGIVHRLDRGTSGLMVVAKHDAAHRALARQFHDRSVTKDYVALIWGRIDKGRTMTSPIGRDPHHRLKMSSRSTHARPASTTILEAEPCNGLTLVRLRIGTGRTHQIRVHLSEAGHPIAGDALYGGVRRTGDGHTATSKLTRPFLHAQHLAFLHPISRQPLSFDSPLPADLRSVLSALDRAGAGGR